MTAAVLLQEVKNGARVVLHATGADTQRFLQGLLSADLVGPFARPPVSALAASLLTVKGGLVSEVIVAPSDEGFFLLIPADVADEVQAKLDKHIIMDDVIVTRTDRAVGFAWPDPPAEPGHGVAVFRTRHPAPGHLLLGPPEAVRAAVGQGPGGDPESFERHRIETASPAWGRELRPGRLPPELGFAYAVSYDKGCFMGQEPLARVHARGQVNRVLVTVKCPGTPPLPLALKVSHPDREKAGEWTSVAPDGDGSVGLALLHRSLAVPGTELAAADGTILTVTSGPCGDDPGLSGKDQARAARAGLRGV